MRRQLASHLTEHQGLPTTEDQLVITGGAQEALWLLTRILPARVILASCPTYPGLTSAVGGSRITVRLCYVPPGGAFGHAVAALFGADPKSEMDSDLLRMKTIIETGRVPHDAAQPVPRES